MSPESSGRGSSVVVVIPTYNERENIESLITAVRSHGYRVIVVDDGSPDGTGDIVEGLSATDADVTCVHRSAKAGLGPAYAEGFSRALESDDSVICQMDADFSHDPAVLPQLVAGVEGDADLAIGSRYVPGGSTPDWPWLRRFISNGGNVYARIMLGASIKDMTGGFRAWNRAGLTAADPGSCHASGYAFQVETALRTARAGCRVVEVPIQFKDRVAGESKMDLPIVLEAMRLVTRWGLSRVLPWLR